MKKLSHILICIYCILSVQMSSAQEAQKELKWDVKLSNSFLSDSRFKNFRIEGNYSLFPCVETGVYFGYDNGNINHAAQSGYLPTFMSNKYYTWDWGVQLNFHPLMFWTESYSQKPRLDFWLGLKAGKKIYCDVFLPGEYYDYESTWNPENEDFDFEYIPYSREDKDVQKTYYNTRCISLGVAYYLKMNLGFYVEYGYAFRKWDSGDIRWGISYAF